MATYTENYNLKKPTYAEPANVKDINDNMEIIDDVMHNTQISLADAYDQNETYNTGDIVMYEMLMYKCKEDNVTGAWNASKWERTTAGESGGGADLDIYGEASGTAEASFSDGAEASLVKCIVEIEATQSGSGTPSPSNIRPISGHTDVTVTVASTSGGSGEDTTVSLGRTVYGGTLDITTGELTVTHGIVTENDFQAPSGTNARGLYYVNVPTTYPLAIANGQGISNMLELKNADRGWGSSTPCFSIGVSGFPTRVYGTFTTLEEFKTEYAGLQIVYELATPQTFNITPTQVKTLLGQNYVSHDGGGTISLVYIKKDSTIIPNPAGAEIPLTGIEINGEKFKIAGGEYSETSLYTYTGSTRQTVLNLNDSITNYDALVFTFDWIYSGFTLENVDIIPTSKMQQNHFVQCGGEGRFNFVALGSDNTEILLATIEGTWDGATIIREVRGIKY